MPLNSLSAVQMTSGTTQEIGNVLPRGTTTYVILYSYPSTAAVGTNLTISLTLQVRALTGIIQYITDYNLVAKVFIGSHVLNATYGSATGAAHLYPGSSWGPNNVTIPLTEANTGLAKGQTENATIAIVLTDQALYGPPINVYEPEPQMQADGGTLLIENGVTTTTSTGPDSGTLSTYLAYALLASGALLMVVAAVLPRVPKTVAT